jgi:hypothetical protein
LKVWQKREGLQDWKINLRVVRKSELPGYIDGDVNWWQKPGTATIRVLCAADLARTEGMSPSEVRHETELIIVHELMHLTLYPLGLEMGRAPRNPALKP